MGIDIRGLTGFHEESLEIGFETPTKLTFTIAALRADDPLLDVVPIYDYILNNGTSNVVVLSGYIRQINEKLSPDEDKQTYVLEDRWKDFEQEALLEDDDFGTQTSRFFLNADGTVTIDGALSGVEPGDNASGPQSTLYKLINALVAKSAIVTCTEWPETGTDLVAAQIDPTKSGAPIERNIAVEGRGIGEMLTEILKYNPRYRVAINSSTGCLRLVNLETAPVKAVNLDKISGKYYLNNPISDVIEVDLNIDRSDCVQHVRLEGRGAFSNQTVALEGTWLFTCPGFIVGTPLYPNDFMSDHNDFASITPHDNRYWAAGTLKDCLRRWYASSWVFPAGANPAPYVFNKETGQLSSSGEPEILIEVAQPHRNTKCCDIPATLASLGTQNFAQPLLEPPESPTLFNNCIPLDPSPTDDCPNGGRYCWTDKTWVEVARLKKLPKLAEVPSIIDLLGTMIVVDRYVWDAYPQKYFAMLGAWQVCPPPEGIPPDLTDGNPCPLPCHPHIEPYDVRAHYTEQDGSLVVTASGGCPNGRTHQRYNSDWFDFIDEDGAYVRHDSLFMQQFANNLMIALGRPKVSGTIKIHLYPVNADLTNPDVWLGNKEAAGTRETFRLGDRLNIDYALPRTEDYEIGPGELADGMPGSGPVLAVADKTWANMELNIMSMSFNRREQTLVLNVANSPFVFGDRLVNSLQR